MRTLECQGTFAESCYSDRAHAINARRSIGDRKLLLVQVCACVCMSACVSIRTSVGSPVAIHACVSGSFRRELLLHSAHAINAWRSIGGRSPASGCPFDCTWPSGLGPCLQVNFCYYQNTTNKGQ